MIIYVDASVIQTGNGTKENPFKTIQEAAAKALPGDEVIVAPGLYREAVNPIHAGTADKRITYRSLLDMVTEEKQCLRISQSLQVVR